MPCAPHPARLAHVVPLLLLVAACGLPAPARAQLVFVVEPPARLHFSNSTGARVQCAALGAPAPVVSWLAEGAPVTRVPGLREVLPNGTLWLGAFSPAQYRGDVHAAAYRCRAASSAGVILSRDMRLHAVMDVPWEARVQAAGAGAGAALLACALPAAVRAHVAVTRWLRDGRELPPGAAEPGAAYNVGGVRRDLLVLRDARAQAGSAYACEALHTLTGQTRRSAPLVLSLPQSAGSIAPRMLAASQDESVQQGEDVRLVCCAAGEPAPVYSWFRQKDGRPSAVSGDVHVSVAQQVLEIRRAQPAHSGVWACRAHNAHGEQRRDVRLAVRARLAVRVQPALQVANSGSSVTFECSVEGGGEARVRWLHDGVPVGGGERALHVHGVARAHRGMYQCFAERDQDSAQAAAELRLGDTAPELHYTFIEQALHPGPALALHCAASGAPAPRFSWLLDAQPVDEHAAPHRSISQFMNSNGDVVSYLNISSVRAADGGRYTCRAHNSRGAAEHSARLNVYGPPAVRGVPPVRVVAGLNATVYCPYSGFPISEIRWQRSAQGAGAAAAAARAGAGEELRLWPADPGDAGLYTCRVAAPSGLSAQKDVQIFVRNPPKIAGFSFPTDLVEGSTIQVLCGITSGDKPVYFSWLKDGQPIPASLQVQEKSLNEFSFLIFSHVTSKHSGDYTCVASNSAAEVNHTARLAVKVAPSWLLEPQDVSALLGTQILAHCATQGYPAPRVTWHKEQGTDSGEFRPISNLDLQFSVHPNGTLSISPAAHHHEGQYLCRAENGIGRGLSKMIGVSVNEPAHFEFSSRNMSVQRTAPAALQCDARGDPPLQLQWTHNMRPVDLASYRVSVSEKRSERGASSVLSIAHAERADSGVYRCRAENAFGRDELLIYLAVQEFPEAPRNLRVTKREARGAVISWWRGFDGNAPVHAYRLQLRVVGARQRADGDDWGLAPVRDVPADRVRERLEPEEAGSGPGPALEYRVEGLRPATAYALRLAAVNVIGDSDFSDAIIVQTMEEAPSEPPHNVHVQAPAPGELLVTWQAPPQDSWNGELLGYVVTWREAGASAGDNASQALTAPGWAAARALLPGLRAHAHYELRVRAFNAVGAGPASVPRAAATLEGVPEEPPLGVRCEPLSATSLRVWWEALAPPARGGVLLGYELLYGVVDDLEGRVETRRAGGTEAVLQALRRAGNYSVRVRARTAAGAGPAAAPAICATHEDVPGAPADIKALADSEDSVVVSWLAPAQRNGRITHYTVYSRARSGQAPAALAVAAPAGDELQAALRDLRDQVYEFWVTAATAAGEGDMSAVVVCRPSARAPAKITSFGRRVEAALGARVRIACRAAGAPAPLRAWSRARAAPPPAADPRLLLEGDHLLILSLDRSLVDNYTCTVRNPWGEERATWQVRALAAPARPLLRLAGTGAARLQLTWQPGPEPEPVGIHSFTLEYCAAGAATWRRAWLPGVLRAHALERLECGAAYRVRLVAHNALGASEPSDELLVSTKGGLPKPPPEKDLITANSSCVRVNLLTWDSNGCPLQRFVVSLRGAAGGAWHALSEPPGVSPAWLCALAPATWYQLRVLATSTAGTTQGNYYFSTLTEDGERIPAPAQFPPDAEGGVGRAAALATSGALLLLLLLGAVAWRRRCAGRGARGAGRGRRISLQRAVCYSAGAACLHKRREQGDEAAREDKALEQRDNRRNCQQVYTSSPSKLLAGKKDQQELYEISPYATFSMSGGTGSAAGAEGSAALPVVGGATLRTFGRAEPAPLGAAPPRPPPTHKHRSPTNSDEYTLSRAMTLMVRREESESDSSGSPCAECAAGGAYRVAAAPAGPGVGAGGAVARHAAEDALRAVTDSSAESTGDARPRPPRPLDKPRRRPRRNHAPAGSRYQHQQRQEQARRDFTIHV